MSILNSETKENAVKDVEKKLSVENNVIRYLTVKYHKLDLTKEYFSKNNLNYEKR